MLGESMSLLFKPLKQVAESLFVVSLESRETEGWFPVITYYCRSTSEAKDVSAYEHGAGIQHPCVRCHSTYEDMVIEEGAQPP